LQSDSSMADELLKSQRLATLKDSIMKVTDEKLMWPEIKKRIDQGDIQYILALNMAKKKIEGTFSPYFPILIC